MSRYPTVTLARWRRRLRNVLMPDSGEEAASSQPRRAWRAAAVRLLVGLGLISLVGLAGVWASNPAPDTFVYELGKALLQLLTVIVIGGGLTLVTFNYQRARDEHRESQQRERDEVRESQQRERDELRESQQRARDEYRDLQERSDTVLRDLLRDALKSFHDVKRARRVLRAHRVRTADGEHIEVAAYEAQIAAINDAQLDFERLKVVAGVIRDARVDVQLLVRRFHTIEKYLSTLVTEYERKRPTIESTLFLNDLKDLHGCIDETRKSIFRNGVANPIKAVVTHLQTALVLPLPSVNQEAAFATSRAETANESSTVEGNKSQAPGPRG